IWIRQPAPSESFGSQPTAPRWLRFFSTPRPCSTMVCDFLPLMCATKPTPQASCSWSGWYSPWACKLMTELLNIHLLRCSDNGFARLAQIDAFAQARVADWIEQHETHPPLRRPPVERHQLEQPVRAERG